VCEIDVTLPEANVRMMTHLPGSPLGLFSRLHPCPYIKRKKKKAQSESQATRKSSISPSIIESQGLHSLCPPVALKNKKDQSTSTHGQDNVI
jgi:hypothetical protein